MPKFGTKTGLFGYFWARILKNYYHVLNQHPLNAKFCKETKMPKFGNKNAFLGIFGMEFENDIVIFEISTLEFV